MASHRGERVLGKSAITDISEPVKLRQRLSFLDSICIIGGVIVGSGIFISPRGVLFSSGSTGLTLVIWSVCGMYSMLGALCYAELGSSLPYSGGEFVYILKTFGRVTAFLYVWVAVFVMTPATNAITALTFAEYFLGPLYKGCSPTPTSVILLAAVIVCLLTLLNCYSVRWMTVMQDSLCVVKLSTLLIIIVTGIVYLSYGQTDAFSDAFKGSSYRTPDIAFAIYSGMFFFNGWNSLNFVTEEINNSHVVLPRAIFITMPLVTVLSLMAIVAYFAVLTREEILTVDAIAMAFGDQALGKMSWIMSVFVTLSAIGSLNGTIFTFSRLIYVCAREGQLPTALSLLNISHFTPITSLVVLCALTLVYLPSPDILRLITFTSFVDTVFRTVTVGSLIRLRIKYPHMKRPFKVPLIIPLVFILASCVIIMLPLFSKPNDSIIGVFVILTGIPSYFLFIYWKPKLMLFEKCHGSITRFTQKLTISLPEDTNEEEDFLREPKEGEGNSK